MSIPKECLDIGLVLLSSDFRVIGMNKLAEEVLGLNLEGPGETYFASRLRKNSFNDLFSKFRVRPNIQATRVIDTANKVLIASIFEVALKKPLRPIFAMTFMDITDQIGAGANPRTGAMEFKKFPICSKGTLHFLDIKSLYFIRADANYCKVFTETGSYYLQLSLKNILQRYPDAGLFRVHKSFIVNIERVHGIEQDPHGRTTIIFDKKTIPSIPVARRKVGELKKLLGIVDSS